jgi:hypothetical protein
MRILHGLIVPDQLQLKDVNHGYCTNDAVRSIGVFRRHDVGHGARVCPERASVPDVRITIRLGRELDWLYSDQFRGKLLICSQC